MQQHQRPPSLPATTAAAFSHREVLRADRDKLPARRPVEARHVVVAAAVRAVQAHRRHRLGRRGRAPDLQQLADRNGDVRAVGAELRGAHRRLEGHVVQQHAPLAVDDKRAAVLVDGEQEAAVGREAERADLLEVLKGQRLARRVREVDLFLMALMLCCGGVVVWCVVRLALCDQLYTHRGQSAGSPPPCSCASIPLQATAAIRRTKGARARAHLRDLVADGRQQLGAVQQ